jgi:hypothetical protein
MSCTNRARFLIAAIVILLPATGSAQEVMSFIDLTRTNEKPVDLSPEDLEFLKAFARGMNVPINEKGEIPHCQWRSPLKTPGAFVDASNYGDNGWLFYVRAPFPRRNTTLQSLTLSKRPEFPQVAYLEFMGTFNDTTGAPNWRFVHLVLPPVTIPGSRFDHFSYADIAGGGVTAERPRILQGPPGLPSRVVLPGRTFDRMLAGLSRNASFTAQVGRLATSAASPPTIRMNAAFQTLPGDLNNIRAHIKDMKRRHSAGQCLVLSSSCLDGRCG